MFRATLPLFGSLILVSASPLLADMRAFLEGQLAAMKRDEDYKYDMQYFDGVHEESIRARLKRILLKQRQNATFYYDDA